jgi:hypothetical protein
MGHRTLLAYDRSGGDRSGYDLHDAHWGVDPADIGPETPFGGPPDDGWARDRADDLLEPEGGRLAGDAPDTAVDPDPIETGLSFLEVCGRVDPLEHEALYVVSPDFSVRTYLVVALRVDGGGPLTTLVGYEGARDAAYLRGWLAGARSVRDTTGAGADSVLRALRWLDPDRGTLVYVAGGRVDGRGI